MLLPCWSNGYRLIVTRDAASMALSSARCSCHPVAAFRFHMRNFKGICHEWFAVEGEGSHYRGGLLQIRRFAQYTGIEGKEPSGAVGLRREGGTRRRRHLGAGCRCRLRRECHGDRKSGVEGKRVA